MKDTSLFLFKNALGARMRKGFKNFCNGDGSTSTLNQRQRTEFCSTESLSSSCMVAQGRVDYLSPPDRLDNNIAQLTGRGRERESQPTLEEMILQLEVEEKMARRAAKLDEQRQQRRMSCVNNSDILRSARNALNQYPRFSLDGRDAMYRSSFRNLDPCFGGRRKSVCSKTGLVSPAEDGLLITDSDLKVLLKKGKEAILPSTVAGENVVWCKPGLVAKLMGLEAMPIPVANNNSGNNIQTNKERIKKQQNLRRRRNRVERTRPSSSGVVETKGGCCSKGMEKRRAMMGSAPAGRYCVVKPIALEGLADHHDVEDDDVDAMGWPMRRYI